MRRPLKILIAEDNPNDAELAIAELRRAGFEPDWARVDTEASFLEKLNGELDIVLSDFQMPEFNGLRALELLKQSGLEVPFILISGTIGEETAVKAMKQGATDYLLKDRLGRLGTSVTHALAENSIYRERLRAAEALRIADAQLGQLLEHSPAVLYMLRLVNAKPIPQLVSDNITNMLGFTVAEALRPEWWAEQLHPDDSERATESLAETLILGNSLTEYRVRHKDGHYCWVDDARRLIRDADGKPIEFIGVWTDITERKRAEETIRDMSGHAVRDRRKLVRIELGILIAATAAVFVMSAQFSWFEGMTRWFLAHDATQLDDVSLAVFFVSIGLSAFAFRRWRETETALTGQQQVQAAMGLLHDELDRRVRQRTTELKCSNQALVTEIAGHKQTETGLKESNRRFHEMLENVDLIAVTLDLNGIVTFCNDYLLALTGWKREEVIGADWFTKFLPEPHDAVRKSYFLAIASGKIPSHHENPIKTRSGELRDITWNNTILRDSEGKFIGSASIGEDVTKRNRAERTLQESEERFRQLAENIHEAFWITDIEKHEVIYISPAYEVIWGRTCASLYEAPETWLETMRPEDRDRMELVAREKQSKGGYDEEYRIIRPDGAERWIRDRAFPVRDSSGTVTRCVGVAEDITESKKLQEQFFRAQRMEAVGTLSGGIAHDLNNILAPILMAPAMLREYARSDHERRLLDLIEQSAQRGAHVVRQLLTFSRGSGGERVGVEMRSLFDEMIGIMRETFPREIVIKETVSEDLCVVLGDPTQLHQVIMNLCVNARDAMPGGGTLSLEARNVELRAADVLAYPPAKPGLHIAVSIKDTGEGIAPANLERIFDPFFTTKAPTKGTGLGLSTVLGIIRSHHGFITVTSKLGRGTMFTVYLPAAVEAIDIPDEPAADAPPRGHGELILVVDDEEPIRTATSLTLESHGYRVLTAGEGAQGLAVFVENREEIRLVLTDLMMPVMGGVTLIHALHVLEPGIKILATSGLTDQENHAKLVALGVDGIITKPCDPTVLLKSIAMQLSKIGSPRAMSGKLEGALSA
jgi:PAS domain S-box-containing protein